MHYLYGALPGPHMALRVTCGALVSPIACLIHRCRTSQYHRTFISLSMSLCNDLAVTVFDGVGLAGFKTRANALLYIGLSCYIPFCLPYYFSIFLISVNRLVLWG